MTLPSVTGRVLVVDDVAGVRNMLTALLQRDGHDVTAVADGQAALDEVARLAPDLVLMDIMMPGIDGADACRAIKSDPATRFMPVMLMTGEGDAHARLRGIEAGADDFLEKPIRTHELRARVRALVATKKRIDDMEPAAAIMVTLAILVDSRDPYTAGHCHRLARQARDLGARLGLGVDDLLALERGGFLHDLGKIGIPDAILLKPGPLTSEEYTRMQAHTVIGERLCRELKSLRPICPIVRSHHERIDGSGYPDGLRGSDVPLLAQIMGIVDVFDAMTMTRPYRGARSSGEAYATLVDEADRGKHRRDLVDAFIAMGTAPAQA